MLLAARLEAADVEAAQAENLLESQAAALARCEAHPEEAAAIFATEDGPAYTGSDPLLVVYVHYLRAHPAHYPAGWRLHDYLRGHPLLAPGVYAHWRWLGARPHLSRAWWAWRLQAARQATIRSGGTAPRRSTRRQRQSRPRRAGGSPRYRSSITTLSVAPRSGTRVK